MLLGIDNNERFIKIYKGRVDTVLKMNDNARDEKWTRSIAVGNHNFVGMVKDRLGYKAIGRKVSGGGEDFELRENITPYRASFPD